MDKAKLQDVLNYTPEQEFSDAELALIKQHFADPKLVNAIRKAMLPTISDPDLPIERLGTDAWFGGTDWRQVPADEAKVLIVARQEAVKFILGGLIKLKIMAADHQETEMEQALRRSQDSTK